MSKKKTFGSELRRLRRVHDLAQKDLASEIECSTSYLCEIESGRRGPLDVARIQSLLSAMGEQELLAEMVFLAAKARGSVEISVEGQCEAVTRMVAALALSCENGGVDKHMARKIQGILEGLGIEKESGRKE